MGSWPLSAENSSRMPMKVTVYKREKSSLTFICSGGPGDVHRAGPGECGGGSYGRWTVATAKGASMQHFGAGKGLTVQLYETREDKAI